MSELHYHIKQLKITHLQKKLLVIGAAFLSLGKFINLLISVCLCF